MPKNIPFRVFRQVVTRVMGLTLLVYIPVAVLVDTMCGGTNDLETYLKDAWESLGEAASLLLKGPTS